MDIGSRIKKRRMEIGMTQEELAFKLGYKSRSSINKIELNGRQLTQSKIKLIADALQTTPGYIMGWDNTKNTEGYKLGYLIAKNPTRALEVLELFIPMNDEQYDSLIAFIKATKKE